MRYSLILGGSWNRHFLGDPCPNLVQLAGNWAFYRNRDGALCVTDHAPHETPPLERYSYQWSSAHRVSTPDTRDWYKLVAVFAAPAPLSSPIIQIVVFPVGKRLLVKYECSHLGSRFRSHSVLWTAKLWWNKMMLTCCFIPKLTWIRYDAAKYFGYSIRYSIILILILDTGIRCSIYLVCGSLWLVKLGAK